MPAIHFSHHVCNVENPYAGGDVHKRLTRYFGDHHNGVRVELFHGCPAMRGKPALTTTDRAGVTCKRCPKKMAQGYIYRGPMKAENDTSARVQCWLACCRFHGAPSPWDKRFTKKIIGRVENRERRALADDLRVGLLTIDGLGTIDGFRDRVLREVERVPPQYRGALRSAFDEWTMAADLADEMAKMLARSKLTLDAVCERIGGGWGGDAVSEAS
jgi:hypothetical protein